MAQLAQLEQPQFAQPQWMRIDRHGRVVIPARLRNRLKVKPGDTLVAWMEGDHLVVQTKSELIRDLKARFRKKPGQKSLVDALREMRDEDFKSEMRDEELYREPKR